MIYSFEYAINATSFFFDVIGAIILVAAAVMIVFRLLDTEIISRKGNMHKALRRSFTHHINFALEFFIAGDILRTILVSDLQSIAKLGAIVTIRVVMGYMLEKESE